MYHYLHEDSSDLLPPSSIANINEGAKMLIRHIGAEDDALIVVDSDCDGYTSSATLINYLNRLFPNYVQTHIHTFIHSDKTHGLSDVEVLDNFRLVICPDASSNDYEEHTELKSRGIDVLVIDHHEAERVSPDACVINNQLCDYPTKSLSGVGMVYKFCCYLDEILGKNIAPDYEDLVALGLIADMMDLRYFETSYLVRTGLQKITNPLFREMMNRQARQFENGITATGIAFYIAPYINAMTRSGTLVEKQCLFNAMLEYKAYQLVPSTKRGCSGQIESIVEQAGRTCINVKSRQTRVQKAGVEAIEAIIEKDHLLQNKIIAIRVPAETVDKNLAGLIANQLTAKYQQPIMILRGVEYEDGLKWEGSCRCYDGSALKDFKQFLNTLGYCNYAEGHPNAFGCSIDDNKFDDFIKASNEALKDFDFTPRYDVDFIFQAQDINDNLVYEIGNYEELWGQDLKEPLIAIEKIKVSADTVSLLGSDKGTLKMSLSDDLKTSFIKFKLTDEEKELFGNTTGYFYINVVGNFTLNHFNGFVTPQIKIKDYEIIKQVKFDF